MIRARLWCRGGTIIPCAATDDDDDGLTSFGTSSGGCKMVAKSMASNASSMTSINEAVGTTMMVELVLPSVREGNDQSHALRGGCVVVVVVVAVPARDFWAFSLDGGATGSIIIHDIDVHPTKSSSRHRLLPVISMFEKANVVHRITWRRRRRGRSVWNCDYTPREKCA